MFPDTAAQTLQAQCALRKTPLALLGAEVTIFDISEGNKRYALEAAEAAGVKISFEVGDVLEMDCTGNIQLVRF